MADERVFVRALEAELVSRFADDVAHEIRNPLNALVINIEVLRRRIASGEIEAAHDRIDVIQQEVGRVHGIIERFIALLRPTFGTGTSNVQDALNDVLPLLRLRAASIRAELGDTDAVEAVTTISRDRLRYAFLDAGMAAFDRLEPGGRLACTATARDRGCRIVWSGPQAAEAPGADGLRLARVILDEAGGGISASEAGEDPFRIVLDLPVLA